jgi:hypothetical protein
VFTIEFNPVDKVDIFDTIKGTFDDLVSKDVFVIGITPTSTLPVNTGLQVQIAHMHIQRFRIGLLVNHSNYTGLELGEYRRHCSQMHMRRGIRCGRTAERAGGVLWIVGGTCR